MYYITNIIIIYTINITYYKTQSILRLRKHCFIRIILKFIVNFVSTSLNVTIPVTVQHWASKGESYIRTQAGLYCWASRSRLHLGVTHFIFVLLKRYHIGRIVRITHKH